MTQYIIGTKMFGSLGRTGARKSNPTNRFVEIAFIIRSRPLTPAREPFDWSLEFHFIDLALHSFK